mmetsp:Transcript_8955/g.17523  ORF Transcript_8955/g.17523 Transcript_8955/m.17523 type:complete len:84 (+) Transcript_8955:397-648(+)
MVENLLQLCGRVSQIPEDFHYCWHLLRLENMAWNSFVVQHHTDFLAQGSFNDFESLQRSHLVATAVCFANCSAAFAGSVFITF